MSLQSVHKYPIRSTPEASELRTRLMEANYAWQREYHDPIDTERRAKERLASALLQYGDDQW